MWRYNNVRSNSRSDYMSSRDTQDLLVNLTHAHPSDSTSVLVHTMTGDTEAKVTIAGSAGRHDVDEDLNEEFPEMSADVHSLYHSFDEDTWTYEEALDKSGFGAFQILLTVICGWANASDAVEILSVSFILPTAHCDMKLSSTQQGILGSIMFVGMLIGGYVWGYIADIHGRRNTLIFSLSVNALMALASSFAQHFYVFLFLRLLSGVGVGGSVPVVFSYFAEFQPKRHRGKMISWVAFFWMCGNIIAASLAWAIIPNSFLGYSSPGSSFQYQSWRVFLAVCTVPSLSSAIVFYFLPESPKYLLSVGRSRDAIDVLANIFVFNNKLWCRRIPSPQRLTAADYPVHSLIMSRARKACQLERNSSIQIQVYSRSHDGFQNRSINYVSWCGSKAVGLLKETYSLYQPPLMKNSIVLSVQMFTLSFGYYGLWLWLPNLLSRMKDSGGSPCNLPNLNDTESACGPNGQANINNSVYTDSFITSLSNLPGNLLTILLVDVTGRKILLIFSMLVSGITVYFIWLVRTEVQILVVACIFGGISTIGWNVLDVIYVEMYPTDKRSLAIGFLTMIGRIASISSNLTFGVFIDFHCAIPIFSVSILLICGGILAFFLPEMTNKESD